MLKKGTGEFCPFYDAALPGCRIHSVKPQVCRAAYYLSKMNLMLCEEHKEVCAIPNCPADARLRARLAELGRRLDGDPQAREKLEKLFSSGGPEAEIFLLFLRLKGMEIYFGRERAEVLARKMGIARVPGDREMRGAGWMYFARIISSGAWQISNAPTLILSQHPDACIGNRGHEYSPWVQMSYPSSNFV